MTTARSLWQRVHTAQKIILYAHTTPAVITLVQSRLHDTTVVCELRDPSLVEMGAYDSRDGSPQFSHLEFMETCPQAATVSINSRLCLSTIVDDGGNLATDYLATDTHMHWRHSRLVSHQSLRQEPRQPAPAQSERHTQLLQKKKET